MAKNLYMKIFRRTLNDLLKKLKDEGKLIRYITRLSKEESIHKYCRKHINRKYMKRNST